MDQIIMKTWNVGKPSGSSLMPNGEQQRQMRCFAGCARYVYNKALALKKERYEKKEQLTRFQLDNCWCSGSRKHRGLEKPRLTHYSKRFSTSIGPTRISSRGAPSSRSSTRKECEIRFENRTKSASSWSKGTTASNCQRLVGYATAT